VMFAPSSLEAQVAMTVNEDRFVIWESS